MSLRANNFNIILTQLVKVVAFSVKIIIIKIRIPRFWWPIGVVSSWLIPNPFNATFDQLFEQYVSEV